MFTKPHPYYTTNQPDMQDDFDPFSEDGLPPWEDSLKTLPEEKREEIHPASEKLIQKTLYWYAADDAGNADAVCYLHKDEIIYTGAYGWLFWTGTHYERDAEARVWCAVEDTLRARRKAAYDLGRVKDQELEKQAQAVLEAARANAYRVRGCMDSLKARMTRDVEEFDADPDKINVQNGVLDLRTGDVEAHNPSQRYTYCIPVNYNTEASYTAWEKQLLETVGGGRDMVDFLQEAVGYTLTGHTSEECLFYAFGPSRSGKGTYCETLQAMLGSLSAGVPFNTFTRRRDTGNDQGFDLAPLKQARFIVASESERNERLKEGMVKEITGGGTIRASFKHRDAFEYRPAFKIWLTSNWSIKADADDSALWRRVRVIEFPNGKAEGQEDPDIKRRMKSPENLEGVLNWAVAGAKRWYERGRLDVPQMVRDSRDAQREENDTVGQWLKDCAKSEEPVAGEFNEGGEVRRSYEQWCREQGYQPKGARGLNESLRRRGFEPNAQRRNPSTRGHEKGVKNLRLND